MADTLESLELEVKYKATGAAGEIGAVADAVIKLRDALKGVVPKLKSLADTMAGINNPLTINDYHDNTIQQSIQKVGSTAKSAAKDVAPLTDGIRMWIADASKVDILETKFVDLSRAMNQAFEEGDAQKALKYREQIIRVTDALIKAKEASSGQQPTAPTPTSGADQQIIATATSVDLLKMRLQSLNAAMQQAFGEGKTEKAAALRAQILSTEKALAKAEKAARGTGKSFREMAKEAAGTGSPLQKMISSLKRIAFYRIIRSIIKNIGQAFNEGMQAAYLFSSGISTSGHRFAEAMDNIKSSGNAMKGQLGSAFIALYAAIAPVLISIINLVTRVADAIAQMLSAFTGSTYLKANTTAAKFADNMKAGGAAAKEWKNQLLGFDEINRLNEPNQGGGSSAKNPLDGFAFEDSPIEEKFMRFADNVKNTLQWIKDHMDLIKGIALAIGGALLTWKIGSFLSNLTGIPRAMSTVLDLAIAIGGAIMFVVGACDAWKNGVDWDNMALMIGGVALAATGLGLAFGGVAAAVALLIGGIAMLVIGIRDWIKTGELSTQTFWLLEAAIVAVGVALGILIGWPAALVAGFVAALGVVIYYWDEIIARIVTAIQAIKDFFSMKSINARVDAATADGSIYLQGFATGGFPDEGQLFMAREAGPELVGTMGGRTAVANNQEITDGIRQAVYDAMTASNANGNNDVSVRVYLDSREIKAGQQRLNRAWGVG